MDDAIDIGALRSAVAAGRIRWRTHALERMLQREITLDEVRTAISDGEMIEVYATDRPFPSCLILEATGEPLHVVVAFDASDNICHVISAYRPDADRFEPDLKTRRRPT